MTTRWDAVLFDWAGTLTPYHRIDVLSHWIAAAGVAHPEDGEAIGTSLHEAEGRVMARVRETWQSATMADVFEEADVEVEDAILHAYREEWQPHTITDTSAGQVMRRARGLGLGVAVVSNTLWERSWHDEIFRRDGILDDIDVAVYSSEVGHVKPHPLLFQNALEGLGNPEPHRCLFVGDRLHEDIWGAAQLGMQTAFVPHSTLPGVELGPQEGEPDIVLHHLHDLVPLLRSGR
ncbi:MAG: HAD family hydrolase [Gordonia polyisoprenivorans]|nr:HAD family hydrolase [Gordonia polyisoprenivorans]